MNTNKVITAMQKWADACLDLGGRDCRIPIVDLRGWIAALRTHQPAEPVERGWLIERSINGSPKWLDANGELFCWTGNSNQAIRFCRRADAEHVAEIIGDDAEKITEHQWGPDTPAEPGIIAEESLSDAEVDANLKAAGIDMTEANERLHAMVAGAKHLEKPVEALWVQSAITAAAADLQAKCERLEGELAEVAKGGTLPFRGKDSMSIEECAENNLCRICGFTITGQAADMTMEAGGVISEIVHDGCKRAEAAESQITSLQSQLAAAKEEAELPAAVLKVCRQRNWSLHWTARGAYLHLEASELIEAIRGKHGVPMEEAADVLIVLMSITEHAGIEWQAVVNQAWAKVRGLQEKPPYKGEEREASPSPARPSGEEVEAGILEYVRVSDAVTIAQIAAEARRIVEGGAH